eukprot:GFUD01030217.1.p1 GENE.GFUD01030217.1~~GFUD01030217.1.p1  ORF type:complete len:299 (-),score=99.42 GFUD01030217.1:622-1485(-)
MQTSPDQSAQITDLPNVTEKPVLKATQSEESSWISVTEKVKSTHVHTSSDRQQTEPDQQNASTSYEEDMSAVQSFKITSIDDLQTKQSESSEAERSTHVSSQGLNPEVSNQANENTEYEGNTTTNMVIESENVNPEPTSSSEAMISTATQYQESSTKEQIDISEKQTENTKYEENTLTSFEVDHSTTIKENNTFKQWKTNENENNTKESTQSLEDKSMKAYTPTTEEITKSNNYKDTVVNKGEEELDSTKMFTILTNNETVNIDDDLEIDTDLKATTAVFEMSVDLL